MALCSSVWVPHVLATVACAFERISCSDDKTGVQRGPAHARCIAEVTPIILQGWRTSMEDAHTGELDVDGKNSAFFGVYDGAPHCEKRPYFAATAHHHHNGAQIGLCGPNSLLFSAMLCPLRT